MLFVISRFLSSSRSVIYVCATWLTRVKITATLDSFLAEQIGASGLVGTAQSTPDIQFPVHCRAKPGKVNFVFVCSGIQNIAPALLGWT